MPRKATHNPLWAPALLALGLVAGLASAAWGQRAFHDALLEGQAAQEAGDYNAAIEAYQRARIERPDAEIVDYALGAAHFFKGRELAGQERLDAAAIELDKAQSEFDKLTESGNARLRREAAHAAASARAYQALLQDDTTHHQEKLDRLREAIEGYEQVLDEDPGHDRAPQGLDAARYHLKQLLMAEQPPPPPQDGEGDEDEEDGEDQEQDGPGQQQQQQQEEQEQDEQAPDEDGDQDRDDDGTGEQPDDAPQTGDEEFDPDAQQPPGQPDHDGDDQQPGEPGEDEQEQQVSREPLPEPDLDEEALQNIEAILQSLEDVDEREQRGMRQIPPGRELRGDWW